MLERVLRDILDLAREVGPVAGVVQGRLVDVGGIDLDPPAEGGVSHNAREHHRHRVRLLARRASGAPHPDRILRPARGKKLRHDLVRHVFPRLGITEEPAGVDQQRVEQLGELFAVELQVVEVVLGALRPDRTHPLGDPALDGRALVAGEVEAARLLDERQERLERPVRTGRVHAALAPVRRP